MMFTAHLLHRNEHEHTPWIFVHEQCRADGTGAIAPGIRPGTSLARKAK